MIAQPTRHLPFLEAELTPPQILLYRSHPTQDPIFVTFDQAGACWGEE